MDTVKEDLCLFNELLFALSGFYSRSYQLGSTFELSSFERRFSTLHCLPQIAELLNLSRLYVQINEYLADYSTQTDQFKFLIYDLINKAIEKTYTKDLISFDLYHKLNNETVIKLNSLLKYKYFFIDILNILNELNDDNKSLALLKLNNLFAIKYELTQNEGEEENDPFFQGMWTWLVSGTLPYDLRNSFFISSQSSLDNYCLDYSKFPHTIEPRNAMQIHNIGNLIRYIHSHGVLTNLDHSQLFWKFFQQRHSLYNSSVLFKYFLGDIKSFVFENILQITKAKESFLEYLQHLKIFFLFGNECFWTNFAYICQNSSPNCEGRTLFRRAIYETFDDQTADYYISCISVKAERNNSAFSLKLAFKHSPMIKIMLSENSLSKYQIIFAHMYKLHSTRCELIANWNRCRSQSGNLKRNYLHYCLLHIFTTLYTYCKFCVEYKMASYLESIESTIEIDQIQKLHDTCLLDIIKRLFIKNSFIANLQNELVQLSLSLYQPDSNVDSQLKKYNQIVEVYRNCFQHNRKHINMFSEILDLI